MSNVNARHDRVVGFGDDHPVGAEMPCWGARIRTWIWQKHVDIRPRTILGFDDDVEALVGYGSWKHRRVETPEGDLQEVVAGAYREVCCGGK